MLEQPICRTCGGKLIKRETRKKASQLNQAYYYTAYYYCPTCQKIYHHDKFKVINKSRPTFSEDFSAPLPRSETEPSENPNNKLAQEGFDAEIWTDGACVFNGRHNARAAWAFVSGQVEMAGLVPGAKQTNNVAEGLAILHALKWAVKNNYKKIKIYSDSQITINNLKKPSSYIKQNREIFQQAESLISENKLTVYYEKVLGHSGDINNTKADRLANQLANKSSR
jgi:ribonuclease HI